MRGVVLRVGAQAGGGGGDLFSDGAGTSDGGGGDDYELDTWDPETSKALVGEFGAREVRDYEKAFNFGSNPLGHADTGHIQKIPDGLKEVIGLAAQQINEEGNAEVTEDVERERMLRMCPGFQLVKKGMFGQAIAQDVRGKDEAGAEQIAGLYRKVAEDAGRAGDLVVTVSGEKVGLELTGADQKLTKNCFLLAARINEVDIAAYKQPFKNKRYY